MHVTWNADVALFGLVVDQGLISLDTVEIFVAHCMDLNQDLLGDCCLMMVTVGVYQSSYKNMY